MKRFTAIVAAICLLTACSEDFLDRHSLTSLGADSFWKNEKDAMLGINGVYDVLQSQQLYAGNLGVEAGMPLYDNFSDNCYNQYRFEGPGNYVEGNISAASAGMFDNFWLVNYRGVVRANEAIINIAKMTSDQISEEKKNNLVAQAKFLRALFYFHLAVYYEDVPLITESQTLENAYVSKSPQQQVMAQVIDDLTAAAPLLPPAQPAEHYGYATRGAAYGLLARVYLYNNKWPEAAAAAKNVIDLQQYNLSTSYAVQFTEDGEKSKDVVFSVRFQEAAGFNTSETFSATYIGQPKVNSQPMPNLIKEFYCTDGKPITTSPLYNASNQKANRDPRLLASVWFKNDVFITDQNKIFNGNNNTGYGLKKYIRTKNTALGSGPAVAGGQDFYVLRYADVLLMRAEALIESNQTGDEVYALINQVRQRTGVNMPKIETVEGTGLSQVQLRDIVRHERRVEFAFEGLRFFDLKRWGQVEAAYGRMVADKITSYVPRYQGKRSETFPIPLREMDANKNLTQHEAWR